MKELFLISLIFLSTALWGQQKKTKTGTRSATKTVETKKGPATIQPTTGKAPLPKVAPNTKGISGAVKSTPGMEDDTNTFVLIHEPNGFAKPVEEEEIFDFAEEMPEFPGGPDSLKKFIARHIVYPVGTECAGKVYVRFVIEKDGAVSMPEVARGISGCPHYDKEALRVIKLIPKFKPGKMAGKVVRVRYVLPIKFTN